MATPTAEKTSRSAASREKARTIALIVIAVLATAFAVLNTTSVEVNWIVGKSSAPLIIVIAVSILAGVLVTYLGERITRRRRGEG